MDRYIYVLSISFSLWILSIPAIAMPASDAKFYSINSIYGISTRQAFSICKDDKGFLWVSSKMGVSRISDSNCRSYQLPFKTADIISTGIVYSNSVLLVYTNNGQLFLYDELFDRFDLFLDLRALLKYNYLSVNKIFLDKEHTLWIPTSIGLYKYEQERLSLVKNELNVDIKYILPYDSTYLFVATEKELQLLDVNTQQGKSLLNFYSNDSCLQVSKLFYQKRTDRLWIGTFHDGLFYYDLKEKQLAKIPIECFPRQSILAIEENSDSTLLIGIDGQGIWKLSDNGNSVLNVLKEDIDNPFSLKGDGVYDIFCDNNKVWVATFSGGLSFFEQESSLVSLIDHKINQSNSLVNNHVNNILEDKKGDIWFATNNGISRWKSTVNKWENYFPNKKTEKGQVFLALCEDCQGNIWTGGYSSGFCVLDRNTGKEQEIYSQKMAELQSPVEHVYDIFRDSEGDIWLVGIHNVICYLTEEKRFREYMSQPAISIIELSPGKIILACTYGLLLLDKASGDLDVLLEGYLIQDLLVIDKEIWLATQGDGLIRYNTKNRTSRQITTESGLPSNYVNSILHSGDYLWIGTENGLCQLTVAGCKIHTYSSVLDFSGFAFNTNSCTVLKNGDLIWGTNKGAIMFAPDKLYQNQLNGQIFFQDINISGRSIRENKALLRNTPVNNQAKLSLQYYQNTLTLELLPIGVSAAEIKFSWKLEGLDEEWSQPSNQQMITYTNIPNGDFQLRVRMYDNTHSQLIDERSLQLHIVPPFWKAWWFRLALVILILSMLVYFLRIYTNRLQQKHAKDKIRFFTNMAHDMRTSLTLINAPIEELNKDAELSEKSRYYLDLATVQSERLSLVATQLLDFQKVDIGKEQLFLSMADVVRLLYQRVHIFGTSAKKKNIELIVSSDRDSYTTAIDEVKIEKVIDNLLSNAIKYSYPDSQVKITLSCTEKEWSLTVKDDGIGITDEAKNKLFKEFHRAENAVNSKIVGSGIGLLLIKEYITMHDGKVFFDSKENNGSLFKVTIPFKEANVLPSIELHTLPEDYDANPEPPVISETNENHKDIHILIVEDNDDLQRFLKVTFQEHYKITTANDGYQAWELISKKNPDLVISDILMPRMNGFELCERIKSTFETSHIPVILLTALSERARQLEGLGLGADDYVTKPFDISILKQRIHSILKNRKIIREKAWKLITQTDDTQPVLSNELNDQFVKKAVEAIRKNMADSAFGKDEFASAMYVSPSLLYKKLKALTDQSPSDFIKTIRLNYAMELLQSHKYTITEVSELCGFSSSSYFSTVFKKNFGKLPTDI